MQEPARGGWEGSRLKVTEELVGGISRGIPLGAPGLFKFLNFDVILDPVSRTLPISRISSGPGRWEKLSVPMVRELLGKIFLNIMAATHCQNLHEYAEGLSFLILQKHWWVKLLVLTPGVFWNFSFVR